MNEISKKLMCVQMRSGVEIWVEAEKAERLQDILEHLNQHKFIRFEDQTFNTADVVGVFTASSMSDLTRRKSGAWKCQHGEWHDKGEKCGCIGREDREAIKRREEAIAACGKCTNGFLLDGPGLEASNGVVMCECQKGL